jgi:hypothetical protein
LPKMKSTTATDRSNTPESLRRLELFHLPLMVFEMMNLFSIVFWNC